MSTRKKIYNAFPILWALVHSADEKGIKHPLCSDSFLQSCPLVFHRRLWKGGSGPAQVLHELRLQPLCPAGFHTPWWCKSQSLLSTAPLKALCRCRRTERTQGREMCATAAGNPNISSQSILIQQKSQIHNVQRQENYFLSMGYLKPEKTAIPHWCSC